MDDIVSNIQKFIDMTPPWFGAMLMAILISLLRVVYDRKESSKVRIALEAAICGALTVAASSAVMALHYDSNWHMFIGGFIGFIGSHSIKGIAISVITKKVNDKLKDDNTKD